jgi:hypothetical protein
VSINHRAEAEKHLEVAARNFLRGDNTASALAAAQVHATLAAGDTARADTIAYRHTINTMRFALIRHVAEGLALSEGDEAHQHARGLATYLDSVGLNVDDEVDAYITEQCGYSDAARAYKPPSVRREERLSGDDPWSNPPF